MWHDTWHASKCNLLDLFTTLFTSFVPKDISQLIIFFLKNQFYLFIYFWLRWVFVAAHGLSLVAASRGILFVEVHGRLIAVASLVAENGL